MAAQDSTAVTPLIPVFSGIVQDQSVQLCNARELWQFVGSKRDFSNWIKERIEKYGFVEGDDYLVNKFVVQVPHQGGVRNTTIIDYHLTIDTAKEIAMVENNDKGRQVRRYFIAVEKAARAAGVSLPAFITAAQAGELATRIAERFPEGKHRPYAWSRFNNHFRISGYKTLPASKYEEALAYIATLPTKGSGDRPELLEHIKHARFCLTFDDNGAMNLREIPEGARMLTDDQIAPMIAEPGEIPIKALPGIIESAAKRLKAAA